MKKNMRLWVIGLCTALVIAIAALAVWAASRRRDHLNRDNLNRYTAEENRIMTEMMEAMKIPEASGSPSLLFLKGMIPHHEAAIRMAEEYLNLGENNSGLGNIARNIVSAQETELEQMNRLVKQYETEEAEASQTDLQEENLKEYKEEYEEEYKEMLSAAPMSHHMSSSGADSIDQAFAQGMILHHQMAVEMAEDILEYTDKQEIKDLAEKIIEVQENEMEQLKSWVR